MAHGLIRTTATVALGLLISRGPAAGDSPGRPAPPNRLSPDETKAGWRLLFDGTTTAGWRGFKSTAFPHEVWAVEDGALARVAKPGLPGGGRDIVTVDTFGDFDLRWEWRVSPAGNSGVKYLVTEDRSGPIAHEYQILDDERHPDAKVGPHRQAAAFYDVLPPGPAKALRPVGEWNESRILVQGAHVEHWLNGRKVLEYELGSPSLAAAVARSKFKDLPGFGAKIEGRVLLQDHGDPVWYRNIKIQSPPR